MHLHEGFSAIMFYNEYPKLERKTQFSIFFVLVIFCGF